MFALLGYPCSRRENRFQEGEQQKAMREAGAVDYLTKTGPADALIEAIRVCVQASSKDKLPKQSDLKGRTETAG